MNYVVLVRALKMAIYPKELLHIYMNLPKNLPEH